VAAYNRAVPQKIDPRSYHKTIVSAQAGNKLIGDLLTAPHPFMASRLGSAELRCISWYLRRRRGRLFKRAYKGSITHAIRNNAGVFPDDDGFLDRWSDFFLRCITDVDLLGVWFNRHENMICRLYCNGALLTELRGIEPFYHPDPWSVSLAGQRVLVVHPFADSIERQYAVHRQCLFQNTNILPLFSLTTVKAVQSLAGEDTPYANWFEAYEAMCSSIERKEFDVALIGAGAYGLPLAAFCKRLGKKAIHVGGGLQVLFGIKGKRFDTNPDVSRFFNQYWTRPSASETPTHYLDVENGCYW